MTTDESPAGAVREAPGLLVVGAGVFAAGWVLLGIVAGKWNPGFFLVALVLMVLASAFGGIAGISLSNGTQRLIGYFMGLYVLATIISYIRYDTWPNETMAWVATIVFFLSGALMFAGARQITD